MITYNHERYIGQAIASVLSQQFDQGLEIVIGEDCSSDRTRAIIQQYASPTPERFVLHLRDQNVGMMANAIDVYSNSRGEYVAFLEGDDYWTDPMKLQQQVDFMDANANFSMCFHQAERVDQSGNALRSFQPPSSKSVLRLEDVIASNPIQTNSILLRRSMLPALPPFIKELHLGDWPICILLAMKGPIGYLDRAMSAYRLHPQSIWSTKSLDFRRRAVIKMYTTLAREYPDLESLICDSIFSELRRVESSLSYKVGFALTAPFRWFLDLKSRYLRQR